MIPDFQTVFFPLLKVMSDGKEHSFSEVVEALEKVFNVTEEEKRVLLPSGQAYVFGNRVGWARTYLKKAGMLDAPRRGVIRITERGMDVVRRNVMDINVKYLKQFPEFVDFHTAKKEEDPATTRTEETATQTPEELLEVSYQSVRNSLAQELMNHVMQLTPSMFEKLVVDLLVKMGYGGSIKDAGKALMRSADEGIDGTIKEDKLGLDVIYIQAKRWQPGNVVGRPEIQKFVGALAGQGAKKGVFITTSSFSREARDYAPRNETKIVLVDGEQLAQMMIDHNLGVTTVNTYELKRIDSDYFDQE